MPARALPGSVRTRRHSPRRGARSTWRWRLAPAIAACALGVEAADQQNFDVRPIYYAMLAAVESSFGAHSELIAEAYRESAQGFEVRAAQRLERLEAEGGEIERARRDAEADFEAERVELNARIAILNETVVQLETDVEGAAAAFESYRQAYEHVLDELRRAESRFRELGAEAAKRGEALQTAVRAVRDGTGEDSREIARLDDSYRRFVSRLSDTFAEREAQLRRDEDFLRTWLSAELENLEHAQRSLVPLAEQYATLEEEHDRAQGELNRRIEVYNERVRTTTEDDAQRDELAALKDEIAGHRESLGAFRERATRLALEIFEHRAALEAGREAFESERQERMAELRLSAETLRSERQNSVALVESRRAVVQARIEEIETRIHARLATLREEMDAAVQRLHEEFGTEPGALLAAMARWIRSLDPALLYGETGAPHFDRTPIRNAAIYAAVDAVRALRLEARSELGDHLADVQRRRIEVARERRRLVERQNAFAAEHSERQIQWKTRLESEIEESRHLQEALDAYFEAKLARFGFEFQALQGALLDVLGASAATPAQPTEGDLRLSSTSEHAVDVESLLDQASMPPDSLLESLAEAGRIRDPDAPEVWWEYLSAESFLGKGTPEERVLEGENELRLLSSWFDRLGTTGILDPLSQWLSHYFPSQSAAQLENALYGLFETGMRNAGDVVRLRWPDGRSAYQVRILDRSYWLQPDGSLLLTPLTW